jgi:hypothetical protein
MKAAAKAIAEGNLTALKNALAKIDNKDGVLFHFHGVLLLILDIHF